MKTNDFHALAFSAEDPNVAYFGHHNGILRTADGGQTWKPLVDRPNFDAMNLAVGPAAGSRMYLAGHDIFQISTDSGATWQPVAHNLPGTDIHGFTMSPDDSNRLIAFVVGHGPLQSSDGGKTWQRLAGSWAASGNVPFASAGGVPEKIYAGSGSTGVVRSNDGGKTWTPAVSGLERRQVMTLAVDPKADQTVYAGTDAGLFKSTNGGISWTKLPYPGAAVFALALSPAQSQRILAISVSNQQGQVYRSDDGGQTWGAH
ncbi:MAG: YCF48-related protein [Chloroflexi bacterium]|nr:YCF48-related protein [Chloroflexota bacterium]